LRAGKACRRHTKRVKYIGHFEETVYYLTHVCSQIIGNKMTDEEFRSDVDSRGRLELEQMLLDLDGEKYPTRLEILKSRLSTLPKLRTEDYNSNFETFIQKNKIYRFHELYIFIVSIIGLIETFSITKWISWGKIGIILCMLIAVLILIFYNKKAIVYWLLFAWWIPQICSFYKEDELNGVISTFTYFNAKILFNLGFEFVHSPYCLSINVLPFIAFIILRISRKYYKSDK
jgi:hypothetical protein